MRYIAFVLVLLLASSVQADTDWSAAPEWNFAQEIGFLATICNIDADNEQFKYRMFGKYSDGDKVADCVRDADNKAQGKFKAVMQSTKFKTEVKNVYIKWLSYVGSISRFASANKSAEQEFRDACSSLRVELETR